MSKSTESVRVSGPLAPYVSGWAEVLAQRGYTKLSARNLLQQVAQMSRWMAGEGLEPRKLTTAQLSRFMRTRRQGGHKLRSERTLGVFLEHLRGLGVVPTDMAAPPTGPMEMLLSRYRTYLDAERGLEPTTIRRYEEVAQLFLSARKTNAGLDLDLDAAEVVKFVLRECSRRSVGSAKNLVTELRSLLRFMHLEGLVGPLAEAVPAVAGWRGGALPRALDPAHVSRLRDSCDRDTALGRRDYAMLTLLIRMGLRAAEVAALELNDFDWSRGEVIIRGKGRRDERLPLPVDVGEALSDYIMSGRPRAECAAVLMRFKAPIGGLTSGAVKAAVRQACRRAGVPVVGAHRLRHTAATELLRAGASLPEVGQVLRHRSLSTTAIYAKVDRASLRELARPWPGGGA